jgi:predicted  nucleic acid-binding Zn-ribbon protein
MLRKWKESDSARLRKLEREHQSLKFEYEMLRDDFRRLEKKVAEKEVTHVQKVHVELHKPFDYDGWYP